MNSLPLQPGYLPLDKAAEWAGVSKKTMKRWIGRGLPRYQAGPREKVLIRPTDIEVFLTRQQVCKADINSMVNEVLRGLKLSEAGN